MILCDPNNPRAQALYTLLQETLHNIPITIVIGGDGWMLHCLNNHAEHQPFLGLNAGTLGFLMNSAEDISTLQPALLNREWHVYPFPLLHMKGHAFEDGTIIESQALNDVYVARMGGRTANLRLDIDNICVVERLSCDGLIVATSLGSTAYSSSAGGSPSHPLLEALHITPICPHMPRLRSFVVPQHSNIEISILYPDRRPAQVVSDGISYGQITHVHISCVPNQAQIAFLHTHNFTETMIQKVLRS